MTSVAGATTGVTASRLQGANRYSTAAAMAEATFPKGSNVAVLASGDTFPDALSAAYLAGRMSAPVLLSAKGSLPAETASALSALKVNQVDIVGGPAAVSAGVEQTLKNDGYMVRRLYGANRDVTAQVVAEAYPS
ncbi:MAG: cell wall-binding repeat-containing protein, partial [Acidimicrobiales bacterium]